MRIMSKILRCVVGASLAFLSMWQVQESVAQTNPTEILTDVIVQLQTGAPNQFFYGAQLFQIILLQTGGTGIYPQLRSLGNVEDVRVTAEVPLPQGVIYKMIAQHEKGQSIWDLGISSITNQIEYANFVANYSYKPTHPRSKKQPSSDQDDGSKSDSSSACRKFPNLC